MAIRYITSKKREITLGDKLGDGAEGDVYKVHESSQEAFKLYKPEKRTSEREHKLEAMIIAPPDDDSRALRPPHISIAWPTEIVYERDTNRFVGFVMPLIPKSPDIFEVYNPKLRKENQLAITWQHLHRIARNFAAALSSLHLAGHIMGDVNQKNVLVADNSLVTLVDTDSFQVTDSHNGQIYRCTVGVAEYTSPELQGLKFDSLDRNTYHDSFGLAVILFQILMEGFHPFAGAPKDPTKSVVAATPDAGIKSGIFPYQSNNELNPPPDAPDFQVLHPEVQQLFLRCFVDGHKNPKLRPTAQEWIGVLAKAESELAQCKKNSSHWYSKHFGKCHWCEREQKPNPLLSQSPLPIPSSSPTRIQSISVNPLPTIPQTQITQTQQSNLAPQNVGQTQPQSVKNNNLRNGLIAIGGFFLLGIGIINITSSPRHSPSQSSSSNSSNNNSKTTTAIKPTPQQAVLNYYDFINRGTYKQAWDMLPTDLQENKKIHPNGYYSFENWFQKIRPITINDIQIISESSTQSSVKLFYSTRLHGKPLSMTLRYNLVWNNPKQQWMIKSVRKIN